MMELQSLLFISKAKYWLVKATIRAVFKRPEGLGDNEAVEALVKHVHSTNVNDSWHEFQFGFLNMHPPVLPENYQVSIDHFSDDSYEISEIFVIENVTDSCSKDLILSQITKELTTWKSLAAFSSSALMMCDLYLEALFQIAQNHSKSVFKVVLLWK